MGEPVVEVRTFLFPGAGAPLPAQGTAPVDAAAGGGGGVRLDQWLQTLFTDQSRSALKRWIEDGRVVVEGRPAKPSTTLRAGQRVTVNVPPPPRPFPLPQSLPLTVLYDDEAILVIDKAPDMVVHPSPGTVAGGTVVNALLAREGTLSLEGGENRPGIVHRLDRQTSGVLIVARTDAAHRHLAAQFKGRLVEKEYLAFAHGVPARTSGEIDAPIGRSPTQRKKMAIRHDEGGKEATTRWRVERVLGAFCWFRLFPRTGRTHQIRVHLKNLGHPIVCDPTYGREQRITVSELLGRAPQRGEAPVLERHALHAAVLRLHHPSDERWVEFTAPLPADLATIWDLAQPRDGGEAPGA